MIDYLLGLIESHKDLATVIVFFIAFFESMVIIGLLLPGWVLLVAIGGMIGADILSFYPIMFAAYFGAVLGEYLSFYLGFHYHQKILNLSIFKNHQKIVDYSHEFFIKHGIAGVFIGRFFGPTRALVPFIAGISEMSKTTFLWVNTLSGLLWAPLYIIPGILIGAAFNIETVERNYLFLMLFFCGLGLWLSFKYNNDYIKTEKSMRQPIQLIKALTSLSCSILIVVIFILSPQWTLLLQICSVVLEKI